MAKKKRKSRSNVKPILILGAVAAGAYFWLRSQAGLVTFGGINIPFQQIKGGSLNLGLTLPVINASAIAIRVSGFAGYIVAPSGATIGTVFLKTPVTVQAFAQSTLAFQASIGLSDIAMEAGSGAFGGTLPTSWDALLPYLKQFRIKGQVRVTRFGIPIPLEMPLI